MTVEVWKSVVGFEDSYQVSDLGRVRSVDRLVFKTNGRQQFFKGRVLSLTKNACGYPQMILHTNGKPRSVRVHRLIALAFIPNPENKPDVNHKDGVKTNNVLANLEWSTTSENVKHAYDNGLTRIQHRKGTDSHRAKLTPELIRKAKTMRENGATFVEIGKIVGVDESSIRHAISGKTWKYLNE